MKMKIEKFPSNWSDFIFAVVGLSMVCLLSYLDRDLPNDELLFYGFLLSLLLIAIAYFLKVTRYISIENGRLLTLNGQKSFSTDKIDIFSIKYICRQNTYIWRSSDSTLVIYIRDEKGMLRYSALREADFNDEILKKLLKRILEINSSITLDKEYKDFLEGKFDSNGGLRGAPSAHTAESTGVYLKERGERWEEIGHIRKFLDKLQ